MLLMTRNSTQCSIFFIGRNMRQLTKNSDGPTGRGTVLSMCTLFVDARTKVGFCVPAKTGSAMFRRT